MNKHHNWLCASVFASAMAALATIPAIAQSPAGTGGGAGGESGSSSAMPAQQRNPIISREMRPRFRTTTFRRNMGFAATDIRS